MRPLRPTSAWFTLLLGLIAGLPALSIDLSAPTLALLPAALHTTVFVAGLSLSLFVLGFAFGQFAGGRGSDRFGRRPVLKIALGIYVLGGLCCIFATTGDQLAMARLIQGAGAGACSVQAYAIVQDLFVGEAARQKQSYVSVVLTIMPMLAPAFGAVMTGLWGWRSVHAVLAVGGVLLFAVVTSLIAESRTAEPALAFRGLGIVDSLGLMRDTAFRRLAVINALSYAAVFAYIAGAPVVVMTFLGYSSSVYAGVFAGTALALSAGATVNARLAGRISSGALVWPSLILQAAAGLGLVAATWDLSASTAWLLLPPLLIGCFARGIISPNLVYLAISGHRERAGLASAMVGLSQLSLAAATSAALAELLGSFGPISVALTIAALSSAAAALWAVADMGQVVARRL